MGNVWCILKMDRADIDNIFSPYVSDLNVWCGFENRCSGDFYFQDTSRNSSVKSKLK